MVEMSSSSADGVITKAASEALPPMDRKPAVFDAVGVAC